MTALQSQASASTSAPSSVIEIRVLGEPAPQGSKTVTRWGAVRESSKKVHPWRHSVAYACQTSYNGPVLHEPVSVEITFYIPRAKGHYGTGRNAGRLKPSAPMHCTTARAGDIDKLARSTLDGLAVRSGGCLLGDDSQVVELRLRKQYAEGDQCSGALVRVQVMP